MKKQKQFLFWRYWNTPSELQKAAGMLHGWLINMPLHLPHTQNWIVKKPERNLSEPGSIAVKLTFDKPVKVSFRATHPRNQK